MRCEPDKQRFCDPEAMTAAHLIHTVELSDERSVRQFITFWVKSRERGEAWRLAKGLGKEHDREIYHRGLPWLPETFPQANGEWSKHYHLDLHSSPTWADIEPFCGEIPEVIQEEIKVYLAGQV